MTHAVNPIIGTSLTRMYWVGKWVTCLTWLHMVPLVDFCNCIYPIQHTSFRLTFSLPDVTEKAWSVCTWWCVFFFFYLFMLATFIHKGKVLPSRLNLTSVSCTSSLWHMDRVRAVLWLEVNQLSPINNPQFSWHSYFCHVVPHLVLHCMLVRWNLWACQSAQMAKMQFFSWILSWPGKSRSERRWR